MRSRLSMKMRAPAYIRTPLFDLYRVDGQMERAMSRLIRMKSGGTLVVDETEALTVIDVNTGKFVGKKSLDDTIFKLNCEAAAEIAPADPFTPMSAASL